MGVDRARDALANERWAFTHRTWCGSSLSPPKPLRALQQALAYRPRREWSARIGIRHSVVAQAQFDLIQSRLVSKFVHCALECDMAQRFVRGPHGCGRIPIHAHD